MDGLLGIAYRLTESNDNELSYEDEILLNDDLSESSLAYAVPRDSENREAQGAESPAKSNVVDLSTASTFDIADLRLAFQIQRCELVPFDAPCIGCGNCK